MERKVENVFNVSHNYVMYLMDTESLLFLCSILECITKGSPQEFEMNPGPTHFHCVT